MNVGYRVKLIPHFIKLNSEVWLREWTNSLFSPAKTKARREDSSPQQMHWRKKSYI